MDQQPLLVIIILVAGDIISRAEPNTPLPSKSLFPKTRSTYSEIALRRIYPISIHPNRMAPIKFEKKF